MQIGRAQLTAYSSIAKTSVISFFSGFEPLAFCHSRVPSKSSLRLAAVQNGFRYNAVKQITVCPNETHLRRFFLRPVKIPNEAKEDPDVFSGNSVTIMGWGNKASSILKSVDIQIYSRGWV